MISQYFIERPIFANVIAIITVILGLVCFMNLPVAQYPPIVPPTIQVTARYPGASAEVVANTVGIPIEQAVNGVENSLYMLSTSASDGSYTLTITFNVGTDLNTSTALVQNLVNSALPQLPDSVQPQGVNVKKVSTDILLVVGLYSEDDRFDDTFLSNYAVINLQNPLARLPGVGQIAVRGAGPYSMRVWLNPEKLRYLNLTTQDVVNAIQSQNLQVVAGQLGGPPIPANQTFQFTVNAMGRLADVGQFENIVIKSTRSESAQIVRIRDVARVELSRQSYSNFSESSGHKATVMPVFTLPGANALSVAEEVKKAMATMSKDFPPGLKYEIHYDTTKFVRSAIHDVYITLFEAGLLVLIVVVVFLQNWRATLVPATTIPVTLIGSFAAMSMLGFGINLLTLFALILAIGIVVDDAIVIVENASYHIEQGLAPKEATIKAMQEITGPIMGITLVLTSVFLPAAFLPGITGQLFRQFALVIASTAIISAINALTLKPTQCALWLRPVQDKQVNWFFRGFNKAYGFLERAYVRLVTWMVQRAVAMVLLYMLIIVLSAWRFAYHPTGFLPTEDQGYAMVITQLPDASSQPRVTAVTQSLNEILHKTQGVEAWVTIGGLSILDGANVSNIVTTFIVFDDWSKRGADLSQDAITANLRRDLTPLEESGSLVLVPPPIRGLGQGGGFQLMVEDRQSLGLAELQKAVNEVIRAGNSQSGLQNLISTFNARSPQLFLDIDRTKVESLNIPLNNVFSTLQTYLGSSFVNLFNKFNQVFQVYVQADAPFRLQPEDIKNLYVRNEQGEMVPLGTLLQVKRTVGPELVMRYNLYPAAQIYGAAAPGFSSGQALNLMEQLANNVLPKGMSFDWTATSFQEKQVGNQAYFIYALSITLVFMVLAALYESWTSPLAVVLVVPMALVGVLLALMMRGFDNNLYTQVGLILMIGLACKNAILIVEFARQLQAEGMSVTEAAVEATRRRFRPIVMTSFAFILGVVPLLGASGAGAASQQAIGTVVFGGMLSSTLLAIPFVPVLYVMTQRLATWATDRSKL
ncbi:efflux RND transporter permease subunit [Methylobacter tundripaludum]|uniref:Efflux pump membrane transporter n=1 Tax=Methylobacter tundripaludum (strain ATCC BAA-1195 / DSM 17260 / SV96) TaxID=697282 RepID=G3IZK0_METTV|nr:multidrug efflux RND transporter permease subunit [Methylobacter tundripaludum]EGW20372.1 transporter, hydrophobe/amphiphile efflux-1 (HAE1) family [Methylobacter tundripaludum SV96]